MSAFVRAVVLLSAIGAVACGATTNTGTTSGSPVYVPPRTSDVSNSAPAGPTEVNSSAYGVVPAGQELDVRLQKTLSSETSKVEERFDATTAVDLLQDGRVLVPAGSLVRGVVSAVDPAGRLLDRKGSITLSFDQMTVRGRTYSIRGAATQIFESRGIRDEAGTAGVGAGAGAIVGGILGGIKGAVIGAVIGGGGAIAATDGKDIVLPAGSVVRIRLDTSTQVR